MVVDRVTVIGAGTMGGGIAQLCAGAGLEVSLVDSDPAALERGLQNIRARLDRDVQRQRTTGAAAAACLARLHPSAELGQIGDPLVIEAIVEALPAKLDLFARLGRLAPPATILASNTSSLSITRLAAATGRPDRVIGLHFFNPVAAMRPIEVVRGLETSDATVALVSALAERLGKTVFVVKDSPGFVANRVLLPIINEAVGLLQEQVATAEAIDGIVTLGLNHPMGPLRLADLVGLDVCLAVMETLHQELGEDRYRPHPLLRRMVAAGRLGRKSGRGFYDYGETT